MPQYVAEQCPSITHGRFLWSSSNSKTINTSSEDRILNLWCTNHYEIHCLLWYLSDLHCVTWPGLKGVLNLAQCQRRPHTLFLCARLVTWQCIQSVVWDFWFSWQWAFRSGMRCYAVWYLGIDVPEEPTASIFRIEKCKPEAGGNKILWNFSCWASDWGVGVHITRTVLNEKLTVTKLNRKFPTFYGNWRSITVFTTAHCWTLSRANKSGAELLTLLKFYFLEIDFNIILHSMPTSSKWSLPFRFFWLKTVYATHFSTNACYMPRPS
jgi:hypothetical protein